MGAAGRTTLAIEAPSARCGKCGFTTTLAGRWTVTDGRLVWRAEDDPAPFRGPDLEWCGECGTRLTSVTVSETPFDGGWVDRRLTGVERSEAIRRAKELQTKRYGDAS